MILASGVLFTDTELPDPPWLSMGLRDMRTRNSGGLIRVTHAEIVEVSVVPRAAHQPYSHATLAA